MSPGNSDVPVFVGLPLGRFSSDCLEFFQLQRAQVRLETLSEARKKAQGLFNRVERLSGATSLRIKGGL